MTKRNQTRLNARNADRYMLYEQAVQSPQREAQYIERLYQRLRGRKATFLREDFCGTAAVCCSWVKSRSRHQAIGIDLDPVPLRWARQHNLTGLSADERQRLRLVRRNVLDVTRPRVDILVALNFSYFIFKTRAGLKQYFRTVRRALKPGGMLLLDAYGGSEAQEVLKERRRCKGFTYIWDHADFNPITSETVCHIHFEFRNGSRLQRAFTYDWRLWSLVELQELLREAGFARSDVYWEGTDHDSGEGDGVFRRAVRAEQTRSWIAYIVALV